MKYLCIDKPGKAVVYNDEEYPVRKEGEAIIKLLYGGICGSDLGSYRGTYAYVNTKRIIGHEVAAEIVDIGENDRGLKKGMVVTLNPYFNCGHCYSCRRGLVNCCIDNQTLGCQRDGAFHEYYSIPVDRLFDGGDIPPEKLVLVEPFVISYHGIKKADIQPGQRVLIVGAGTIGVFAALAAKHFGAKVYLCDVAEQKLQYIRWVSAFTYSVENREFIGPRMNTDLISEVISYSHMNSKLFFKLLWTADIIYAFLEFTAETRSNGIWFNTQNTKAVRKIEVLSR